MEQQFRVVKRSIDARQKQLKVHLTVLTDEHGAPLPKDAPIPLYEPPHFQDVHNAEHSVAIIGAGPAGLFAALTLIEHGIRPIIYERGKEVADRKKDIATLNRNQGLNAESNYCFGEGGAGTFSDGKLFSRSKKRGNMQRVMELFHHFGGDDRLLYEAHAHIGSDKLPTIIRRMRECIIEHGGEIHFSTCVDESLFRSLINHTTRHHSALNSSLEGRMGGSFPLLGIILAIGHSAHDTYQMLMDEGVLLEDKGFAMGVRAEHPQDLINRLMYHDPSPELVKLLGNASYSLVTQVQGRGVYSFCMCPGGTVVPAATDSAQVVVNGMSASHRSGAWSNSGMVVETRVEDIDGELRPFMQEALQDEDFAVQYQGMTKSDHPLCMMAFQAALERATWIQGGRRQVAPAQRMADFVNRRLSADLPASSYSAGLIASPLHFWMPRFVVTRLAEGFKKSLLLSDCN